MFIPSLAELKIFTRSELIRKVTPYAISHGASNYPAYTKKEKEFKDNGWYWTRTPFKPSYDPQRSNNVWYASYRGSFEFRTVWGYDIGVVLMMRIKL